MTADAPIRQCLPMRTSGPIIACGPMMVPSPICAAGSTCAVGCTAAAPELDGEQQLGLGHDLIVHVRGRLHARQTRPGSLQRHFQPEAIAGDDAATELGAVDAAERGSRRERCAGTIEDEHRRHLRQRLDHQHGGHQRRAGEMPLKELLTDGHVLHRHEPVARLVLSDRVDEIRRVSVVDAPEERRKV